MILYHGSNSKIENINDSGIFGGLFASVSEDTALSHGSCLHTIEIDDTKVLTNYVLNYELDYAKVLMAFEEVTGIDNTDDNFDDAWESIIEDKGNPNIDAEESWEKQRLRGLVAAKLGYAAVEMNDEHGVSYLVLSGATINAA